MVGSLAERSVDDPGRPTARRVGRGATRAAQRRGATAWPPDARPGFYQAVAAGNGAGAERPPRA